MEDKNVILQNYAVNFLEYQKGRALNQRRQVELENVEYDQETAEIKASVRDLSSRYDTWIKLDITTDLYNEKWDSFLIRESFCSCNEYHVEDKLCRHRIAVLLQYLSNGSEKASVNTSAACTGMINNYKNRFSYEYPLVAEHSIKIIPRFIIRDRQINMEFYVGTRHMYLIRDLVEFKKAYQKGLTVSFGKMLCYRNTESAYVQGYSDLVQVLCLHLESYLHHEYRNGINGYFNLPKIQELELEEGFADLYMKAVKNISPEIVMPDGSCCEAMIIDKDPDIRLLIEKKGMDGVHMWLSERWHMAMGNRHMYLFNKDRIYICSETFNNEMLFFMKSILLKSFPGAGHFDMNTRDLPGFIRYVLPAVQKHAEIEAADIDLAEYAPPELQIDFYFSTNKDDELELLVRSAYGIYEVILGHDEDSSGSVTRDMKKETEILRLIRQDFSERGKTDYFISAEEDQYVFMEKKLPIFYNIGNVHLDESLQKITFRDAPKITAGMSFMNHFLNLEFSSDEIEKSELAGILASYSEKKKYHLMDDGTVFRLDESTAEQLSALSEHLELEKDDFEKDSLSIPGYRMLYTSDLLSKDSDITLIQSEEIRSITENMKNMDVSDCELPPSMEEVLRDYQKYGFRWMKTLKKYGFNGILADDMGLGKTIQIISLILSDRGKGTSLVVCPASLIYNWSHEFDLFAPDIKKLIIDGTAEERKQKIESFSDFDVLITSYDLLRRDVDDFENCSFYYLVLDEAQFIKNHHTMNAKSVKRLNAAHRFALTGTPIENRLSELWSIFDFLMPGYLFSYAKFRKIFENPILKNDDETARDQLRKMVAVFLLRRNKKDVLYDLPDKTELTVYAGMEGTQKQLYRAASMELMEKLNSDDGWYYDKNRIEVLSQLTRLRQICCHPSLCFEDYDGGSAKLEACMELVQRAISGGHKILLFSQFTSMLDIIKLRLSEESIDYLCLTGSTDKEERMELVSRFQNSDIPVFLISLKAGGTGLNLTAADIVIHYDPWWNVAAQNQATDRTHRIGQSRNVTVYKLIAEDTLEEGIIKLQKSKQALSDDILSMDFGAVASLSREDLMLFLSGSFSG